jgi:toxin ParE1/3/4
MTRRLVIRQQAEREMREASAWYDEQRAGLGAEFERALDIVFQNLKEFPEAHPTIFGPARRVVMSRFPYMIFYRLRRDGVISVTGCIHSHRAPDYWKRRV